MTPARVAGPKSMTGFGTSRIVVGEASCEVELRTVNHRTFKWNHRLPEGWGSLLPRIEQLLRKRIARGSVYLHIRPTGSWGAVSFRLDRNLLTTLFSELGEIATSLGTEPPHLGQVAALPGVVRPEGERIDAEGVWGQLETLVGECLDQLDSMRLREGAAIANSLNTASLEVLRLLDLVEKDAPRVVQERLVRLRSRLQELLEDSTFDSKDLAREMALLADKSDIQEEIDRIRSHIQQLQGSLDNPTRPLGRKLEFLAQELMRESNTMASKTHDAELIQTILSIKVHVEQLREQIANLE